MTTDERKAVERLFFEIAEGWNAADAAALAAPFLDSGVMIGYDGSESKGKDEILRSMSAVFADHRVGRWVSAVRDVRFPSSEVAILSAVTGWIRPGADEFPQANQLMVAVRSKGGWRVASLQATPAAYHGSPEKASALQNELRAIAARRT